MKIIDITNKKEGTRHTRKWMKLTNDGRVTFNYVFKLDGKNFIERDVWFNSDEVEDFIKTIKKEFSLFDMDKVRSMISKDMKLLENRVKIAFKLGLLWGTPIGFLIGAILTKLVF